MATRNNYIRSRDAAVANIRKLEREGDGYLSPSHLFRGRDATAARERRRTGRPKSEAEIKRQLGRIARSAVSLHKSNKGALTNDNTEFKRVNRAFFAASKMLNVG